MSNSIRFSATELRVATSLAALFFLRMLGLFMLLPVLALYVEKLEHATPLLIGLALGIYALTQAALQIPMGRLSDRIGRKPVIAFGLAVFVAGSALAALSENVYLVIAGRALQGAGAISSAALALAADLTTPQQRTKVMAIIGVSIGLSFSIAFVLGPTIDGQLGLNGLFWVAGGLGILGIVVLTLWVPSAERKVDRSSTSEHAVIGEGLRATYVGGFCLHGILAASFVAIPLHLLNGLALESAEHYRIYLPVILISLLGVAPIILMSTRLDWQQVTTYGSISALIIGELVLATAGVGVISTLAALTVFFIGFNYLESALPSQVSRNAPEANRGSALGTYATLQFIGTFCGATAGGFALAQVGIKGVFFLAAMMGATWLTIVLLGNRSSAPVDA